MTIFTKIIAVIAVIVICLAISFGISAALVYGICWAFNLTFTWKIAFGVWLVLSLLSGFFKTIVTRD